MSGTARRLSEDFLKAEKEMDCDLPNLGKKGNTVSLQYWLYSYLLKLPEEKKAREIPLAWGKYIDGMFNGSVTVADFTEVDISEETREALIDAFLCGYDEYITEEFGE